MRVLLVNPNRYSSPPVPPVGLEHVAAETERAGHEPVILDLCFSADPLSDLEDCLKSYRPSTVGITVRNIDTVLYQSNEFFLDGIREYVRAVKSISGVPVVIGGAGVPADPGGVLDYLGADAAVVGPAEGICGEVFGKMGRGERTERVCRRRYNFDLSLGRRRSGVDYGRYLSGGGVAGFATHSGCTSSCPYCMEAQTPVSFRPVGEVIGEIRLFADEGSTRFHLCDPEFNEEPDYCISFCEGLIRSGLKIDWGVYMKPAGFSRRLIRLMSQAGVSLITLSVDSWRKCPQYWEEIEKTVFAARSAGIRIVVDFLCGFPYEKDDVLPSYLDLFRRVSPDSVGINTYIRLYRGIRLSGIIMRDEQLKAGLTGCTEDGSLIRPVFYNSISEARLMELIGGDRLFRIEGLDKGVNYQRVRS